MSVLARFESIDGGRATARSSKPSWTCRHAVIRLWSDRPGRFIDITDAVAELVADSRLRTGVVNVQTQHTTAGIVVNEHEPLLLGDLEAMLERIAPAAAGYRHDDLTSRTVNVVDGERPNGHAHCKALLLPTSAAVNVASGRLQLGRWQRLFFVDLDGPRERAVSVVIFGCVSRRSESPERAAARTRS
jgi:secondary thiamine-phosphate synthase enzyme